MKIIKHIGANGILYSIIIAAFAIGYTPYLLSKYFWTKCGYAETGQIGDTVGGLTAPFIGLLSAVLVYLALKEQIKANKLLMIQVDLQYLFISLDKMERDVEKLDDFISNLGIQIIEIRNIEGESVQNIKILYPENFSEITYTLSNIDMSLKQAGQILDSSKVATLLAQRIIKIYNISFKEKLKSLRSTSGLMDTEGKWARFVSISEEIEREILKVNQKIH